MYALKNLSIVLLKKLFLISTTRLSSMPSAKPCLRRSLWPHRCAHHPLLGKYLFSPNSTPGTEPDALVQPHKPTQESSTANRGAGLGDAQVSAQSADSVALFLLTSTSACTAPGVLRGPPGLCSGDSFSRGLGSVRWGLGFGSSGSEATSLTDVTLIVRVLDKREVGGLQVSCSLSSP